MSDTTALDGITADTPLAEGLRALADNDAVIWDVARRAIEDELVEFRDSRLSMLGRNNGLVIKEKDGAESSIIRFGPEYAVTIALHALANLLDPKEKA